MIPQGNKTKDSIEYTNTARPGWNNLGPDSMICWIAETSQGFTNVGLYRISKSIRAYVYLILSSQASARSRIIDHMASASIAQRVGYSGARIFIQYMYSYILSTFVYVGVCMCVCVCVWIVFIFANGVYIYVCFLCVHVYHVEGLFKLVTYMSYS